MSAADDVTAQAVEVLRAHEIASGYDWCEEPYSFCRCGARDVGAQHQADMLRADGLLADPDATARGKAEVFDYPTGWAVMAKTKPEHHHEACSYRTTSGGVLCDCAAMTAATAAWDARADRIDPEEKR